LGDTLEEKGAAMPRLDFYINYQRFVTFKLGQTGVLIGRAVDCDIQLPAEAVSRHHSRILPTQGGGFSIEDMSTNGTRVNAAMIEGRTPLQPGDRIYIEDYVLIFQADDAPPETFDDDQTTLHGDGVSSPG
jgi:pSer/pThr/pTyr-binding forkhead associated (FHA) protein